MVILSPDDMCYPLFLLLFIIGGYIDCVSYLIEFFVSDMTNISLQNLHRYGYNVPAFF